MYTAKVDCFHSALMVLRALDGMTLTLHSQKDVEPFVVFDSWLETFGAERSLRLNVFEGIDLAGVDLSRWKVKDNIRWIENCPLPDNEVFMRLRD